MFRSAPTGNCRGASTASAVLYTLCRDYQGLPSAWPFLGSCSCILLLERLVFVAYMVEGALRLYRYGLRDWLPQLGSRRCVMATQQQGGCLGHRARRCGCSWEARVAVAMRLWLLGEQPSWRVPATAAAMQGQSYSLPGLQVRPWGQ